MASCNWGQLNRPSANDLNDKKNGAVVAEIPVVGKKARKDSSKCLMR